MIDPELLRKQPDTVKESLVKRGENPNILDDYLKAEQAWKKALQAFEPLQAEKKRLSGSGKPSTTQLRQAQAVDKKLKGKQHDLNEKNAARVEILLRLPNLVAPDVPTGKEAANQVLKQVGKIRLREGKTHGELMEQNQWLDRKTAAQFSGSRFRYLERTAALAHIRLMHEAVEFAYKRGFVPIVPPVLVREETLEKSGFFPTFREDVFAVEKDNLFLTGTSEQTLLALVAGQKFSVTELPKRFAAFSTCFRREAGSYGKDVDGMFRQHQFDKVELVSIVSPEQSESELEFLVRQEEDFVRQLGLPYQLVMVASEELGPTATKKIDLETWFPGQGRYRETHSASNCTDYQARRLGIKVKRSDGTEVMAHTLNATLATERLLLALIENNQRSDGRIDLPRRFRG